MPNPLTNSGIRDNHRRGIVADFLKSKIQTGSQLSVVSAYFTIYAYEALEAHLDQIERLNFLFGEPRFIASLDPDKTEKKAFILDGNGLQLANKLQQKRVARECADWIRLKVDIRSVRHAQLLYGKMYHIANGGMEEAIAGRVERVSGRAHDFHVSLNVKHTVAQKLGTLAHELAHVFCGHQGETDRGWWPERRGMDLTAREFEAEAVAYFVTERMALDIGAVEYLAGYLDRDCPLPNYSLETVSAGKVEEMAMGRFRMKPKKKKKK